MPVPHGCELRGIPVLTKSQSEPRNTGAFDSSRPLPRSSSRHRGEKLTPYQQCQQYVLLKIYEDNCRRDGSNLLVQKCHPMVSTHAVGSSSTPSKSTSRGGSARGRSRWSRRGKRGRSRTRSISSRTRVQRQSVAGRDRRITTYMELLNAAFSPKKTTVDSSRTAAKNSGISRSRS